MFGFLSSPCPTCASPSTHGVYRSFFCGLSGALRDDYSPAARFLVNRDSTFLSLMGAAAAPKLPAAVQSTCCNPISTLKPLHSQGEHARFAAAVTVCGLATKLEDDRQDEKGLHRFVAKSLGQAITGMTDQAISLLNTLRFPTAEVVELMRAQNVIEKEKPNLMMATGPTETAYGTIFSHAAQLADSPGDQQRYESLGKNLGRLVYWKDAHDDLAEDNKRGRFNPLTRTDPEEFHHRFAQAAFDLESQARDSRLTSLQPVINQILSGTLARHGSLLTAGDLSLEQKERLAALKLEEEKKGKKEQGRCQNCCDNLICCEVGGEGLCCLGCESISCCS